jgi:hypothetical protein
VCALFASVTCVFLLKVVVDAVRFAFLFKSVSVSLCFFLFIYHELIPVKILFPFPSGIALLLYSYFVDHLRLMQLPKSTSEVVTHPDGTFTVTVKFFPSVRKTSMMLKTKQFMKQSNTWNVAKRRHLQTITMPD